MLVFHLMAFVLQTIVIDLMVRNQTVLLKPSTHSFNLLFRHPTRIWESSCADMLKGAVGAADACTYIQWRVFPRSDTVGHDCGRNAGCPAPPAQIRTSGFPAYGSYLRCLASNRVSGYGCTIRGLGIHRLAKDRKRDQGMR